MEVKINPTQKILSIASIFLIVFAVACTQNAPQDRQPTTEPTSQLSNQPTTQPTGQPASLPSTSTPTPERSANQSDGPSVRPDITLAAGSLLKSPDDPGVFWLNSDGTRQHIPDWPTFLAYGFKEEEIVIVPEDLLQTIPLNGQLSRLVYDSNEQYYQAINGTLQPLTGWDRARPGTSVDGLPATPADQLLLKRMDVALGPVSTLKVAGNGANLRQGPGLNFAVASYAAPNAMLLPVARNEDSSWFAVMDGPDQVWIAASVTTYFGDAGSLPVRHSDAPTTVAATPTATAPPAPTPTAGPITCEEVPIRGFGKVWADHPEIQPYLGCPTTWMPGEHGTNAAVQIFEHGLMVWVEQDRVQGRDPVYVLFYDDHTFQRFRDMGPADPAKVGQTDPGFFAIGDKFSKVYWEGTGVKVKERLGRAIEPAQDSPGAFQTFRQGRMLWLGEIDQIFVIYDYYIYQNKQSIQVKIWAGYEDTF